MRQLLVLCAATLTFAACNCDGGQIHQGQGELTAVETQLYFGETCPKPSDPAYGVDPAVQPLHLRNDGAAAIYLNSFEVQPAEMALIFTFDKASVPEQIAAGDTVEIPLSFLPLQSGTVNATLAIKAEDSTLSIPLLGEGKALPPAPAFSMSCPGGLFPTQDECASGSNYIHFPDAPTNSYSQMSFKLTNSGCPKLSIKNVRVTTDTPSADAATFALADGQPAAFDIAGGATGEIKVRLTPALQTDYDGTLTFETNDPAHAQITLSLTGTGIGPVLDMTTSIGCAHGSSQEDFGCCDFSQLTPCTGKFTLFNHGGQALTLNGVHLKNGTSSQFAIQTAPDAGTTIPPNGSLPNAVVIKYTPAAKLESDLLLVDSSAGQVQADVRGGAPPVLQTNPDALLEFGDGLALSSDQYLPITISNPRTYDQQFALELSSLTISGSVFTLATTSQANCPATLTAPATLAAGQQGSVCVHLAVPNFGGEYQGQLHLANNDPLFAGASNEKIVSLHAKSVCDAPPVAAIQVDADAGNCPCASNLCPATSTCGVSLSTRSALVLSGATSYDPTLDAQCHQSGQDPTAIDKWEWVLFSGPGAAAVSPAGVTTSPTTTLSFDTPGVHTVRLFVYDKAGLKSPYATFTVSVSP